ncbi:MAG: hypothetical protein ACKOI2_09685 [Actinomycetota bacterium]
MTAIQVLDGPVAVSLRRFSDAVHQFVDRQPVWDAGTCRWSPPLYSRMRTAVTGRSVTPGRKSPTSRTPARTSVLDWLCQVDQTVAGWGVGAGTVHTLQSLAAKTYRPQDCDRLEKWSDQLAAWASDAAQLLGDAAIAVPLRGVACPVCGDRHSVRRRDGEVIRSAAIVVSEAGAQCLSCLAAWSTDQLPFLATLLGCDALPAAL